MSYEGGLRTGNFEHNRVMRILRVSKDRVLPNEPVTDAPVSDTSTSDNADITSSNPIIPRPIPPQISSSQQLSPSSSSSRQTIYRRRLLKTIPSGVDKDEERELDLVRVLSEKSRLKTTASSKIPTPEFIKCPEVQSKIYRDNYVLPPDPIKTNTSYYLENNHNCNYDADDEDVSWLSSHFPKKPISLEFFEFVIARFENVNNEQPAEITEELKNDETLCSLFGKELLSKFVESTHEYIKTKRTRLGASLIPRIQTGRFLKADNESVFVVFRRRAQQIQTRKRGIFKEERHKQLSNLLHCLKTPKFLFEALKVREYLKGEKLESKMEVNALRYQRADIIIRETPINRTSFEYQRLLRTLYDELQKSINEDKAEHFQSFGQMESTSATNRDPNCTLNVQDHCSNNLISSVDYEEYLRSSSFNQVDGLREAIKSTTTADVTAIPVAKKRRRNYKSTRAAQIDPHDKRKQPKTRKQVTKLIEKPSRPPISRKRKATRTEHFNKLTELPKRNKIKKRNHLIRRSLADFTFKPKPNCQYQAEDSFDMFECDFNRPQILPELTFHPTSMMVNDKPIYLGLIRRRLTRYGTIVVDRYSGTPGQIIGKPVMIRQRNDPLLSRTDNNNEQFNAETSVQLNKRHCCTNISSELEESVLEQNGDGRNSGLAFTSIVVAENNGERSFLYIEKQNY
ncbi:hypothetical protein GJ496_005174 [Pomphorhynchus laevis]|nr:hypothetical protein GJ496_005174 [Pomphorhynchus laevis]